MLHILLLILKIIAIIIAVILGILVLIIGIVLFMPLKYEVSSECDGTFDGLCAYFKCTWFFRIIRVVACYKEKNFQWSLKLLWFQFPKEEVNAYETEKKYDEEHVEKVEKSEERYKDNKESFESTKEEVQEEPTVYERIETKREKAEKNVPKQKTEDKKTDSRFEKIFKKCKTIYEKIKCTIQNLYAKMKMLLQTKERIRAFIQNESHRRAIFVLKNEAIHLLKRLKPKIIKANIHYGFEDPCTTGQVLAGLAIAYPFIGKSTNIVPDFENKVLEGNLHVKGKIRGVYFLILLWKLFWCKDIRITYKDIKSLKA